MSKRHTQQRVVVTGLGVLSCLGDRSKTWESLLAGRSGIRMISDTDPSVLPVQFAGQIKEFDPSSCLSSKEARRIDLFIQYAVVAAQQAMEDSGYDLSQLDQQVDLDRFGVCVGSGIGGISTIEDQHNVMNQKGAKRLSPFFVPGAITNMAAGNVSIRFGLRGPNLCITTACAAGTHNIGTAANLIASGAVDCMLAGGAEKGSSLLGMAGFAAARSLSSRNEDPQAASRPWDKDRDGFVLSDGAGILLLESYDHAMARGARIYAELIGFGMSGDAHHITSPPDGGDGAARSMQLALDQAGLKPEQVGYINAHGTSTQAGDIAEVNAIKKTFGASAETIAISSTKSMLGHMLGAAGAVEAAVSVLALTEQMAPPTINLDQPDDGCDLNFVPHTAAPFDSSYVMSNSFGFGGTNGSLIFSAVK